MNDQTAIPCVMMRGGTSRGVYFNAADLPADQALRDAVLVRLMGGPDALQIDGVGGGHPLSSKVAVLSPGTEPGVDVDYLFLQVSPSEGTVSSAQNCGNILAGVGGYAIEAGWIVPQEAETRVRVKMLNSQSLCDLYVMTPGCLVSYQGDTAIDGVPGTAAAVTCEFLQIAGSSCGSLLPTGNLIDTIEGVAVTCIDNGMPVVLLRAADLGVTGQETPERLDGDEALKSRLEAIRLKIGPLMNLGDVRLESVPKMTLIAPPVSSGHVGTRTFIPHVCHKAIGVLGAVSVATGCVLPGTVATGVAQLPGNDQRPPDGSHEERRITLEVEHPSGSFLARLGRDEAGAVTSAGVIRTARRLFSGEVCVPTDLWKGNGDRGSDRNHSGRPDKR